MSTLLLPLVFAFLTPLFYALTTIADRFVVSVKVKKPLGYSVIAGIVELFAGIVIMLFLNWKDVHASDIILPLIVGIILGSSTYLYYIIMKHEEVSNYVGLIYFFPVIVALLSFIFLKEVLSPISYIGMAIVLAGAIIISLRRLKLKFKAKTWMILIMVGIIVANVMLVKVMTTNMPELNAAAMTLSFTGAVILFGLFSRRVRKDFISSVPGFKWAILTESPTIAAIFSSFYAVSKLPVSFTSAVGAVQPLIILVLERVVNRFMGKITHYKLTAEKVISIILIVAGMILLYLPQVLKGA